MFQIGKSFSFRFLAMSGEGPSSASYSCDFQSHYASLDLNPLSNAPRNKLPKLPREPAQEGICPDCKGTDHEIELCPVFLQRTPQERIYLIWFWLICFSCLKIHKPFQCKLPKDSKCGEKGCTFKHHVLLHGSGSLRAAQDRYFPIAFKEKIFAARYEKQRLRAARRQHKINFGSKKN